jgi:putative membrane protein
MSNYAVNAIGLAVAPVSRQSFIHDVANALVYELEAAELAVERAQHREVKSFAREVIADFERMGGELRSSLGGTDSRHSPPENLDTSFQTMLDILYDASEDDFDASFIAQLRSSHRAAIDLLQTYRGSGNDRALAGLCGVAVPVLEHHLEAADELNDIL